MSVLQWTPSIEDEGKFLVCRATNPKLQDTGIEERWKLKVHCKCIHRIISRISISLSLSLSFPSPRTILRYKINEIDRNSWRAFALVLDYSIISINLRKPRSPGIAIEIKRRRVGRRGEREGGFVMYASGIREEIDTRRPLL